MTGQAGSFMESAERRKEKGRGLGPLPFLNSIRIDLFWDRNLCFRDKGAADRDLSCLHMPGGIFKVVTSQRLDRPVFHDAVVCSRAS